MTNKLKLQTYIREIMETLTRAGQIVEIPIVDDRPMSRYRAASLQVATRLGMSVTIRTINDTLYARRTDFPKPPPAMPGMERPVSSQDRIIDTLESMRPWPDDVNATRINEALDVALRLADDNIADVMLHTK